jgi:hypothetical protein
MIATPQIRRGFFRLWVVATAVWEVGFAWYLIFIPSRLNDFLRWDVHKPLLEPNHMGLVLSKSGSPRYCCPDTGATTGGFGAR